SLVSQIFKFIAVWLNHNAGTTAFSTGIDKADRGGKIGHIQTTAEVIRQADVIQLGNNPGAFATNIGSCAIITEHNLHLAFTLLTAAEIHIHDAHITTGGCSSNRGLSVA